MAIIPGFEEGSSSDEIFDLIWRDDLTGLFNRRFFARYMKQVADWGPGAEPVCLAMMDMDNLKRINDRLGHLSGDTCLKRIGEIMKEVVPEEVGYAVRYAGDEFALVLPGYERARALELAEALRSAVAKDGYQGANLPDGLCPSLSIGMASFPDDAPAGGDDLTETADKALYHSKRTGKNRVTDAGELASGGASLTDLEALAGFPAAELVGREGAIAQIDDALSSALDGRNSFLLVEGAPGVGKTRLLSEVAKSGRERDLVVLIERCNAVHREEPHKALLGLLETYLRGDRASYELARGALSGKEAAALSEVLPVFRPRNPPPPSPGARPARKPLRARPEHLEGELGDHTPPPAAEPSPPRQESTPRGSARPRESRPSGGFDRATLERELGVRRRPPATIVGADSPPPSGPPPSGPPPSGPPPSGPPPSGAPAPAEASKPAERPRPPGAESEAPATGPQRRVPEPGASGEDGAEPGPRASGVLRRPSASGTGPAPRAGADGLQDSGVRRRPDESGVQSGLEESGRRRGEATPPQRRRPPRRLPPEELGPTLVVALRKVLAALSGERALVLILDDLDAADEATFALIPALLSSPGRVLLVGSARSGDTSIDDVPFAAFREGLSELRSCSRIELGALDAPETAALAERLLQGFAPPEPLAADLFRFSGGNPLFVEGVLRHLIETQLLTRTETGWQVAAALPQAIPVTLEDVLRQGLAILDPETATLLSEGAAVIGPNFEFNVLKPAAGKEPAEPKVDLVSVAVRQSLAASPPNSREHRKRTAPVARPAAIAGSGPEEELLFRVSADSSDSEAAGSDSAGPLDPAVAGADGDAEGRGPRSKGPQSLEQPDSPGSGAAEGPLDDSTFEPGEGEVSPPSASYYRFSRSGDHEAHLQVLRLARERRDQLFSRESLDSILVAAGSNLPEISEEPSLKLAATLPRLARSLAMAVKVTRLYASNSSVVEDALRELFGALERCLAHADAFTIGHRGNSLVLNGHSVDAAYGSGEAQEEVVGLYRLNAIKALTFQAEVSPVELFAFLTECAKHTVQVPLERYFWRVFAKEQDLVRLGISQKAVVLKSKQDTARVRRPMAALRTGEEAHLPLLKEVVRQFMVTLDLLRRRAAAKNAPPLSEPTAELESALRSAFQVLPGLVLLPLEHEEGALDINGARYDHRGLGPAGAAILKVFREGRVRGIMVLPEFGSSELLGFMGRLAGLPAQPEDDEAVGELARDGSFPHIVIGEALFELAHALVKRGRSDETKAMEGIPEYSLDDAPPVDVLLPKPERDPDLPDDFTWPSDALYHEARRLYELKPVQLLDEAGVEFADTLERLFLLADPKAHEAARLVLERVALNFASSDARERRKTAELFATFSAKGGQEVRARFYGAALRRLADALELESDVGVFERLASCARMGILDQIAAGEWEIASQLTRAITRRRAGRSASAEIEHAGRKALEDILSDPRVERLFETVEAGGQQERRKAARVLEAMGDVAVERLVAALEATKRSRVENFLIDMLAALVPTSEAALRKELTPTTGTEAAIKLIRASAVVCRDPAPVFVSGLSHSDQRVQLATLEEARKVGGKIAQQVLSWALSHGSPQVRLEAVKNLGELARPEAVEGLIQLAQTSTLVEVQRECCLAFGKLALTRGHHEKVVPVLATFLTPGFLRKDYHEDVRHAATWALGQMTEAEGARRALKRAADDKDKRVRLTARLTLDGNKTE